MLFRRILGRIATGRSGEEDAERQRELRMEKSLPNVKDTPFEGEAAATTNRFSPLPVRFRLQTTKRSFLRMAAAGN